MDTDERDDHDSQKVPMYIDIDFGREISSRWRNSAALRTSPYVLLLWELQTKLTDSQSSKHNIHN